MAQHPREHQIPHVLEPCARCGGLGVPGIAIRNEAVHGWVQCADCGHRTPADLSYAEAIETWNRSRAAEP